MDKTMSQQIQRDLGSGVAWLSFFLYISWPFILCSVFFLGGAYLAVLLLLKDYSWLCAQDTGESNLV